MTMRRLACACFASSSTSDTLVASGFSTKTCLPAQSALLAKAKWEPAGVATIIASTSGSLRTTSAESTAEVREKLFSTKARRSGLESTTYFTEQFDRAEKFRSKFGPQYPHPTIRASLTTRRKYRPTIVLEQYFGHAN